jgi:Ring finger domain
LEEETDRHECPICMELFQLNDVVSWSPSMECEHVFHHGCIKTWLIHHDCCPYCRLNVLSVDRGTVDATRRSSTVGWKSSSKPKNAHPKEELLQLAQQRHRRLCSSYFCLEEGLVNLDRPLSTSQKKTCRNEGVAQDVRRNIASNVSSEEMMALRLHPQSGGTTSCEDVVVTIQAAANADGFEDEISHFADEVLDIELSRISDQAGLGTYEHRNSTNQSVF